MEGSNGGGGGVVRSIIVPVYAKESTISKWEKIDSEDKQQKTAFWGASGAVIDF